MTPDEIKAIENANRDGKIWSKDVVGRLLDHIDELEEKRRKEAADAITQIGENIELTELAEPLLRLNRALEKRNVAPLRLAVNLKEGRGFLRGLVELMRTDGGGCVGAIVVELSSRTRSEEEEKSPVLTRDQVRAIDLIADGLSTHETARRLGCSVHTLSSRLNAAAKITGARRGAGLVIWCYRSGVFTRAAYNGPRIRVPWGRLDVLNEAVEGLTNAEIGKRLGLTENTVKTHLHRILQDVGAVNRAHLVRRAVDLGVLKI